jgi:hypothetical protein
MRYVVFWVALALLPLPACLSARAQVPTPATPAAPALPSPTGSATPLPEASATPTPPPRRTLIDLKADRIDFYYDQFLIEADGHVSAKTSDGMTVTGDAFSMDLKLNRFLMAGHVSLTTPSGTAGGAAVADFLDFDRLYFVPVTTEPDRWTFLNGDLAHPVKGRVMPGDTFAFPSTPQTPSFSATSAIIGAKEYVRLSGAVAYVGGTRLPLGSYVINFSPNQYFAQNSLSGANFDTTWNFAGNTNSLSAVHLRDDKVNGVYLSFEQHFVGEHEYAIFSLNPMTKAPKYFNALLYEKLGNRLQLQTFTQLYEYQTGFRGPNVAEQTTYVNGIQSFEHSYLQGTAVFTNYNLLGPGSFSPNNPIGPGSLSHPTAVQLTATSFQNRIGKLPLYEQVYYGYGFNHDTVGQQYSFAIPYPGLQEYGGVTYTTIYDTLLGYNLFTPSFKLGNKEDPYKAYYFNASFNSQRTYNSLPHHINIQNTTLSLSRQFSRPTSAYLAYQVNNTGDYYNHGGYQPCDPNNPPNNPFCPPSLSAFRGAATLRTLSLNVNYAPQPDFNASILMRHHDDFPIPVPGLFPQPTLNVLGQPLYSFYLGQPPNDITGDVRFKLLPHMLLDVSRTYYFNFGTQRWSPSFIVQVLPL